MVTLRGTQSLRRQGIEVALLGVVLALLVAPFFRPIGWSSGGRHYLLLARLGSWGSQPAHQYLPGPAGTLGVRNVRLGPVLVEVLDEGWPLKLTADGRLLAR